MPVSWVGKKRRAGFGLPFKNTLLTKEANVLLGRSLFSKRLFYFMSCTGCMMVKPVDEALEHIKQVAKQTATSTNEAQAIYKDSNGKYAYTDATSAIAGMHAIVLFVSQFE